MRASFDISRKTYSDIITGHPKKILVLIIAITIIFAYFASNMSTVTEEELFLPDTEKTNDLREIEENFGEAEDFIQITFVSSGEAMLTVQGMDMLLDLEEEIMADPELSPNLVDSPMTEEGVYTLSTGILTGIRLLEVEEDLVDVLREERDNITSSSFKNQTRVYRHMLNSTEASRSLLQKGYRPVNRNTTSFISNKSTIISDGIEGWRPLEEYGETIDDSEMNFTDAIEILEDDDVPDEEKITYLRFIVEDMDGKSDNITGLNHFADALRSVKNIMTIDDGYHLDDLSSPALTMGVEFLKIPTVEVDVEEAEDRSEIAPEIGEESIEMDIEQRRELLKDMDDEDIEKGFDSLMDYHGEELSNLTGETDRHMTRMRYELEEGVDVLNDLEGEIDHIQDLITSSEVEDYRYAMASNITLVREVIGEIENARRDLESSEALPDIIEEISQGVDMTFVSNGDQDITLAVLTIEPIDDEDERIMLHERGRSIASDVTSEGVESRTFSETLMNEEINETTNESLEILLPLGFVLVVILLVLIYRNALEVIVSLISLGMAIVWTLGIGVLLGYSFNPFLIAVPILITGLVIDYGIHMMMRYREERFSGNLPAEATRLTVLTVGAALVLTTLTTAMGFMSNAFVGIEVVKQFGVLAAVGITSSFVIMVGFLPSVMRIIDETLDSDPRGKTKDDISKAGEALKRSTISSSGKPLATLLVVVLITSMAFYGVINVDTSFDMMDFLPSDSTQRENIDYLHKNFDASGSYSYVLIEGDIARSDFLYHLDDTIKEMEDHELLISDWGIESPLSVITHHGEATPQHPDYDPEFVEMFDEADTNGDGIPDENLTTLYEYLYTDPDTEEEMKSVLERNEMGMFTTAVVKLPENADELSTDLSRAVELEEDIQSAASELEDDYTIKITGHNMINHEATSLLRDAQLRSLIITLVVVLSLLSLVFFIKYGSLWLGTITTIPVILVCVWIIGTMYLMGISLNVMTVTITALTVGMGVDYSIHITHRFIEEMEKRDGISDIVGKTTSSTGMALMGSATTTMAVFLLLSSSEITPLAQFGLITALAIGYSLVVSIYILPALMVIWQRYQKSI